MSILERLARQDLFRQQNYIGGTWCDADDGKTLEVVNPSTGRVIGTVPSMGPAETARAIEAAHQAQKGWAALTAAKRSNLLKALHALMLSHRQDLALIMTLEQGKPLQESLGEIEYSASFIEWFAEEGKRIYGDIIPSPVENRQLLVQKQPIGVFAAITPWNFPSAMITRKAAPGWAAGCAGVIRPASQTPYSALALGVLAEEAGFPAGVCNIVTGPAADVGPTITSSSLVRKLSFTGSTPVGAQLLAECAPTIKKTSMELGGNAPFLVFDDADVDQAIEGVIASKFRNTGQTCVCANRILVQEGIHDLFLEKLVGAVSRLKLGDGFEEGVTLGPLIDSKAVGKVEEHIADALAKGAHLALGGRRGIQGDNFYEATVLSGVSRDARIFSEETFGPVAPIFKFESEDEAVELANDTPFGLAAYFYTRDVGRVYRVSSALEFGIVGVNAGLISTAVAPFGGMKQSGLGREGSKYGIEDYLEVKYVAIGLN